jgi:coenzyme F420-0:L-glutamate ligase/coenzyme F420-1:gamma-L-glutamate ligase
MASTPRAKYAALFPLKLRIVKPRDDLVSVISDALRKQRLKLLDGDVLAVASKAVSIAENRIVRLDTIHASRRAKRLATKWNIDACLTHVVLREADQLLGGVKGFLLTVKHGLLTANAGVDLKNSQPGTATLWPQNANESARRLRRELEELHNSSIGVEIVDSRVTPMRLGTVGLAIGYSGILPVRDERGRADLYGRKVKITQLNIVDDLAAAAHLLMGEADERIAAVLLRGLPASSRDVKTRLSANLAPNRCLIANNLRGMRRA